MRSWPGEQPAIVDRDLFDAVQAKLSEQVNNHKTARMKSEALLAGRIFDDRGNRMTPSHARKRGIKYRYYLSSALLQGQARARRINHAECRQPRSRRWSLRSVREHLKPSAPIDDREPHQHPRCAGRGPAGAIGHPACPSAESQVGTERERAAAPSMSRGTRHRQRGAVRFFCLHPIQPQHARPIRSETRATLVASIARGRRWLNELVDECKSKRRKHREARELQRAQGQHDDLARLPRARPRQGCHRRSTAARHGRHPLARCSRRMVSPTRDARPDRFDLPLLMRLRLPRQERVCGARDKGAKTPSQTRLPRSRDRAPSHETPPIGGPLRPISRKSPSNGECVVGPGGLEPPTRPL